MDSQHCRRTLLESIEPKPEYTDDVTDYIQYADRYALQYPTESDIHTATIYVFRFPERGYLVHVDYDGSCCGCSGTMQSLIAERHKLRFLDRGPTTEEQWQAGGLELVKEWIQAMEWFNHADGVMGYLEGYRGGGYRYRDPVFDEEYAKELVKLRAFLYGS